MKDIITCLCAWPLKELLTGHDFHVSTFVKGTLAWACSTKMSCSVCPHCTAHRRFEDAPGCSQAAKGALAEGFQFWLALTSVLLLQGCNGEESMVASR